MVGMWGEFGSMGMFGQMDPGDAIDFKPESRLMTRRREPVVGPGLVVDTIPVSGISPAMRRERLRELARMGVLLDEVCLRGERRGGDCEAEDSISSRGRFTGVRGEEG